MPETETSEPTPASVNDARAVKILAKSVYRELRANGHSRSDVVGFANELLELLTNELADDAPGAGASPLDG